MEVRAVAEEATKSGDDGPAPLESRWQVARTMCAAYVLCNMDKVRLSASVPLMSPRTVARLGPDSVSLHPLR